MRFQGTELDAAGDGFFASFDGPARAIRCACYPSDPSIFDTLQFYDQSYDPAQAGFSSEVWNFGDGASANSCCPTHRYAADGDYSVTVSVTTTDGRTATSVPQVVHVRTHDVTISKVLVPQTASVGQTRTISVGLTNSRYPETVQVQLLKSVTGGAWQQVGVLSQYVPVRGANRTTNFNFNYTFAPEDAVLGKVSFRQSRPSRVRVTQSPRTTPSSRFRRRLSARDSHVAEGPPPGGPSSHFPQTATNGRPRRAVAFGSQSSQRMLMDFRSATQC